VRSGERLLNGHLESKDATVNRLIEPLDNQKN
jgi:hypothetical protein